MEGFDFGGAFGGGGGYDFGGSAESGNAGGAFRVVNNVESSTSLYLIAGLVVVAVVFMRFK